MFVKRRSSDKLGKRANILASETDETLLPAPLRSSSNFWTQNENERWPIQNFFPTRRFVVVKNKEKFF